MLTRILHILVILLALPVWLFGLLLPLGWLIFAGACQVAVPAGEASINFAWQFKLYASSLLLMAAAGAIAMALATVAAYAFARIGRLTIVWVAAGVLVVPPLVYGYLWMLTLGNWVQLQSLPVPFNLPVPNMGNLALASWSIGLWLWPIPALLLTAGWQWTGRPAWLLARMDTSDLWAFLRAALPAMRPYLLAAWAICLLLAAQEYAIPALFSVQTWQTQYLALSQAGIPLGQLAIASLPSAGLLLALIVLFVRSWRSVESLGPSDLGTAILRPKARLYAWMTLLTLLALATAVPLLGAVHSLTKRLTFNPQRFGDELQNTPSIMAAAATLALAASFLALPSRRRTRSTPGATARPRPENLLHNHEGHEEHEGRRQETEVRSQKSEDRGQATGDREQMAEDSTKKHGKQRGKEEPTIPPSSVSRILYPVSSLLSPGFSLLSPVTCNLSPISCPLSPAIWLPPSMLILSILSWTLPISLMAEAGKQAETSLISLLDSLSHHIPVIDHLLTRYNPFAWLDVLLWIAILAGRMLPVAWVLMAMVARSLPPNLAEQAAVDGADRWQILQRILLPLLAPAAAAAWLICGLLVATDTVAATMLQPAGFQVLAVSLLNQMHYGRDGDIVATCLMTLGIAAGAATLAALTLGKAASDRNLD